MVVTPRGFGFPCSVLFTPGLSQFSAFAYFLTTALFLSPSILLPAGFGLHLSLISLQHLALDGLDLFGLKLTPTQRSQFHCRHKIPEMAREIIWKHTSLAAVWGPTRTGMLCLGVLLTTAGFIFANRSTGTWVRVWLRIDTDDDPVFEANIFTLSTWSTVHDFWRSGARSTALVTGITAGALPYAVLALILATWWCPFDDPKRRSIMAACLLQLVRLEHMLTMAAILLCVALKTDVPLHGPDLRLRTIFGWGTFAFEMANCCCYGLALALCQASGDPEQASVGRRPRSLRYAGAEPILIRLKFKRPRLLRLVLFANCAIAVVSLTVPCIRFTMRELASDLVKTKVRRFSVIGIVQALAGSTRRAEAKAFWTIWLAAICIVIPVASTLALVALFLLRLAPRTRSMLFIVALHLHATSSADVLFVVIANIAQSISLISSWIVNDQAKDICKTVEKDTRYDGCAVVSGFPLPGFAWLAAHTLLNNALFALLFALVYHDRLHPTVAALVPALPLPDDLMDDRESFSCGQPLLATLDGVSAPISFRQGVSEDLSHAGSLSLPPDAPGDSVAFIHELRPTFVATTNPEH